MEVPTRMALWTLLLVVGFQGRALAEVAVPDQTDWVEQGTALTSGPEGSWDARLYGQISPCTVVKKGGTYFLYYVGADGDRATDGGPRNRALGVATSVDGIHFTKHPGNPVLTHQPKNNEEEGIFSAGATLKDDGTVALHYSAIWAANSTTESVQGYVALATSTNGLDFTDQGYVLDWNDGSVWGSGDELFPLGTLKTGNEWAVYYGAKGNGASWDLAVARGSAPDSLGDTAPVLTTNDVIGGSDPIWLSEDKIALFIVRDFGGNFIEVRTAPAADPAQLSAPVKTYTMFPPRYRHTTIFLDKETDTWFMYQATDREEDGNHIIVRTAPAVDVQSPTSVEYEIGPEEAAGSFTGSRPTIAVDSSNQPHIVIDKDWSDVLYIYHKLDGTWSEGKFAQGNWGSDRNYLPHLEIDGKDRGWLSSWYATKNVVDECGQGVWLLDSMSTAPAELFHEKVYITWSNGNMSLDPAFPDECVVMGTEGQWKKVNSAGVVSGSGQMSPGQSGEKIRFLISPGAGGPGVWHAIQSGWPPSPSSYQNSVRHGAGQPVVVWADYEAYPAQGEDTRHPGLGIDTENPQAAYIGIRYGPGLVINVWDGEKMVFTPNSLPVVDAAAHPNGNGPDRFGPQWTPAAGGGAYLCWTGGDGWVKLTKVEQDGVIGATVNVSQGASCAMATDSDGDIHMGYVNGGMRYRKIVPQSGEVLPQDTQGPVFFGFSPELTDRLDPECMVTAQDGDAGLAVGSARYTFSTDHGATWRVVGGEGSNVALNQACEASSEYEQDDRKKEYANDGDPDTQWAPLDGSSEFWWSVDFGATKTIHRIRMVTLGTTDRGKDYYLDFWDGTGWQAILSGVKTTQVVDHSFDAIDTQKVRVYFVSTYGNEESFNEIEVYEVGGEGTVADPAPHQWLEAGCGGVDGDPQATLSATMPFQVYSETANQVRFSIEDLAGNTGFSETYTVSIVPSIMPPADSSGMDIGTPGLDVTGSDIPGSGSDKHGSGDGSAWVIEAEPSDRAPTGGGCGTADRGGPASGWLLLGLPTGALISRRRWGRVFSVR